jgi:PAS domain S-box-containing protein
MQYDEIIKASAQNEGPQWMGELNASEVFHRKLVDSLQNGYACYRVVYEQGRPVDCIHEEVNSGYEKVAGLKNLIGLRISEVLPAIHESGKQFIEKMLNVAGNVTSDHFEMYVEKFAKWLDITIFSPGEGYLVGIFYDISDRMHTEEALGQCEERFRILFENHSAVMILLDPGSGNIIDANQAAANFYGWSREVLCGMNIEQITESSPETAKSNLEKARLSVQNEFVFRHRRADDSWRDVEVFSNTVVINGKEFLHAIIHDISERKHFEALTEFRLRLLEMAEFSSTEELLTFTLDEAERLTASSIGFFNFISDDQKLILRHACSSCAKKDNCGHATHPNVIKSGVCADVVRTQKAVIHNNYSTLRHCNYASVNHEEVGRELIVPFIRNGTVMATLEIGNKPIDYDEDDIRLVSILAGVAWDIITKKNAEESEQKMQKVIQHAQNMELVGQLAGGIAHDFNNKLGIILGYTEMALDDLGPSDRLRAEMEAIHDAATRSADLTSQLLAFARKQVMIQEVLDLNEGIDDMHSMLSRLVGERISLVWDPDKNPCLIMTDRSQIDQMLANLCLNARDSIANIGTISITTEVTRVDGAECDSVFPCAIPGNYVKLTVQDDGSGIDPKDLPHIFEPFFTTKAVGKGTGMGLSTVYGIVKQNNGYVDCQSVPGKGTSFYIYLPQFEKPVAPGQQGPQGNTVIRETRETVLLVDDDLTILKLIKRFLEKNGYTVLSATMPHEAIRIAEQFPETLDLLITDVVMPEMNGCDLSIKISTICPRVKTLFMSAYTAENIARHGVFEKNTHFIRKPFKMDTFIKLIESMLNPA